MMVFSALIYIYRNNTFLKVSHLKFKEVMLPGLYPYFLGGAFFLLAFTIFEPLLTKRGVLFFLIFSHLVPLSAGIASPLLLLHFG